MNFSEYREFVKSVSKADLNKDNLCFYSSGLVGESFEIFDLYKKLHDSSIEFNRKNLVDELGDILWYFTAVAECVSIDLEEEYKAIISQDFNYKNHMSGIPKIGDTIACLLYEASGFLTASYDSHLYLGVNVNFRFRRVFTEYVYFLKENEIDIEDVIAFNVKKLNKKWGISQ